MNETPECQSCCRGSAPWFMCRRSMDCICHKIAHEVAVSSPNRLGHSDRTANIAIGNAMKRNQKR